MLVVSRRMLFSKLSEQHVISVLLLISRKLVNLSMACVLPLGTSQSLAVGTTRGDYLPCSSFKVMVHWSHTSVGPKYWIGPGYTKQVFSAHSSRCAAKSLKGAPSKRTNALRITGFISPLRRSMFIIIVMGTPPATHSSAGAVVFLTMAM